MEITGILEEWNDGRMEKTRLDRIYRIYRTAIQPHHRHRVLRENMLDQNRQAAFCVFAQELSGVKLAARQH